MMRRNRLCLCRVEDIRAEEMHRTPKSLKSISAVTRHGVVTVLSSWLEKSR